MGTQGTVLPLLPARATDPLELLILIDGRRLRVGAGTPAFLPFPPPGRFTAAADAGEGVLAVLDAERGDLWLARGEAVSPALHLLRVGDASSRTRLTLAQRLSRGGGLAILGYSAATGEMIAGDLDLGRAEVAPLSAPARLDAIAEAGACSSPAYRALIDLPVQIRVSGPPGSAGDHRVTAQALVTAGEGRACLLAVEAAIPGPSPAVLRATFGPGGAASRWSPTGTLRGRCVIGKNP
jgi:hypothetical protein